jgi:hypothetical protein
MPSGSVGDGLVVVGVLGELVELDVGGLDVGELDEVVSSGLDGPGLLVLVAPGAGVGPSPPSSSQSATPTAAITTTAATASAISVLRFPFGGGFPDGPHGGPGAPYGGGPGAPYGGGPGWP